MRTRHPDVPETIIVESPAFADGDPIPRRHTCRGGGQPPELTWRGVPPDARSLALVVSDPDAPRGTFLHWLLYDLPPGDGGLPRGMPTRRRPGRGEQRQGARMFPPCPPGGTHRYRFTCTHFANP